MPRLIHADADAELEGYATAPAERTPRMIQDAAARAGRPLPFALPPSPDAAEGEAEAIAYVNDGRWVVDCPACSSAQLAAHSDRRFFCTECHNAAIGGAWRAVRWPPANQLNAVEAELELRPERNRHWRPGQSVDDLRAENEAHGHRVAKRRS